MERVISVGKQNYASIRENEYFYIDKTYFIREWWEYGDEVTLITRPRRFGKTLNMSMLECFFSIKYANRKDLFEGLQIWKEEKYRKIQGTYPVIFLSFASVKARKFEDAKEQIKIQIRKLYEEHRYLLEKGVLSKSEEKQFNIVTDDPNDALLSDAINQLSLYLNRFYKKKVLILLDEYDTPMQEAYLGGYWEEFTEFIRSMFNATFKSNVYIERGILTGITRVSKESIFSDLNNLEVVTTTSDKYATSFGFTEQEVFDSLGELNMKEQAQKVKEWYDGFTFGKHPDIYNPWSITNYLDKKMYNTYWASTSSNGLVNTLLRQGTSAVKQKMEQLLKGKAIQVDLDEQIIFDQLERKKNAIWSFLLASGYLKIVHTDIGDYSGRRSYELALTNKEVMLMFEELVTDWFNTEGEEYNSFIKALLKGNLKEMNAYMNEVALATFSSFDTGKHPSKRMQPERFYHGFVLGLLVELRGEYEILSNGESGYGRYDVMICPLKENNLAFVLEFKVFDAEEEKSLQDTVAAAHAQIDNMGYDIRLRERGIKQENIRHYGFAFEGKRVLIG